MERIVVATDHELQKDWQDNAACAKLDPEVFFPEKEVQATTAAAKAICNKVCTVQTECLQSALDTGEEFGVWGGFSGPERRKLTKRARARRSAA